jgi:histidinol-phosphatase
MTTTAEILTFALELADSADAIAMRDYRSGHSAERKPDGSFVTPADVETETVLRAHIAERFPEHAVLGEEKGDEAGAQEAPARWILDPIDGTHSYMRGIPVWATLIACERGGRIEVGVVSAPALVTRWWAGRDLGAFRGVLGRQGQRGEERIRVSAVSSLGEAQISCGDIVATLDCWPGARGLIDAAWRVRAFGDFWGFCLVAEGSADVMIDGADLSPWDVAALIPIVEEAGGRFTDSDGIGGRAEGAQIATNGLLHEEVVRRLTDSANG